MSFSDRTLTCRDCGQQFTFTAGEQEFYQSRGLMNEPGRCPECRQAVVVPEIDEDEVDGPTS